jgi:hypothetical protein
VRREGDEYVLQDLGSANGTLYNGATVDSVIHLTAGGRIQIGETEIIFDDGTFNSGFGATMITDNSSESLPEATIALASGDRTTSGLLEAIEGARTQPEAIASSVTTVTPKAKQGDLLALISKVGITLLASATLNETLALESCFNEARIPASFHRLSPLVCALWSRIFNCHSVRAWQRFARYDSGHNRRS